MSEKVTDGNVLTVWASLYPQVTQWITKLQKKEQNALGLYKFCEWARMTPPELLAAKEKDFNVSPPPNIIEKLLDQFCGAKIPGFTTASKSIVSIAVKSFFKWNYRDLAKASGVVAVDKVNPYNALTKEGLRKLWFTALNPRDRALITFTCSTGIAKETLSKLTWGHLENDWETKDLPCINIEAQFLKGHGLGKYRGVRQVTFLTNEARRDLKAYKDWIERKLGRNLTPQDHMWLETCKPYRPISYETFGRLMVILSDNAGVPFSWHDGRRWVNTALEQIGISPNWARKIRGRKVKGEEAPYSQPLIEQLRAKYKEAVSLLEFTSETPTVSREIEQRVKALEEFKKTLTPEQEELAKEFDLIKMRKVKDKTEVPPPPPQRSDEDCQRVISESELEGYLKEGWRVIVGLPSGKIVIEH